MELNKEFSQTYILTAGETDAESRMPITLMIERAIETATEHANLLGIGYSTLIENGAGWVLTRMSIKVEKYLEINEQYTVTTWIESYNRLYSDRCYAITDSQGNVAANIRSIWVAMDLQKRTAADLTAFINDPVPISDRICPVTHQRKLPPLSEKAEETNYTFLYSDIDFNRHVNTVQYVRHILNQWSLSFFDAYQIQSFEIAFHHECFFGESVKIRYEQAFENDNVSAKCEIVRDERRIIGCNITFMPRRYNDSTNFHKINPEIWQN